ncbi:putative phage protein gp47/JayE [Streptomyces sp. V3I8]|uniref:baseplate J/gp47 family protein n=1 Tax=Streptomyces sp. V3I8 TaxID=3042279 RepID=UPI002789C946|nr:baseplate J/gp47 family protein [Streptomyces sp. V3I8]MDQ1041412.1 putative phage protein gp47/JayE [Streptomyces sp. V3I8]
MAVSRDDIVTQLRDALLISDPEIDTSVGTPLRKIMDAFSASLADAYIENHLLSYAYDIDSKSDADLDAFTSLFGISRIPSRRAFGTVTFSRTGDLTPTVFIPVGTEVASSSDTALIVQLVTGATMMPGSASVTVPVQAVAAGPEGNLGAGVATVVTSPIQGVNSVVNTAALTGGTSRETDTELRARWKATVFRSMAGTEQMYLGVALDDTDCYAAQVVGSSKTRSEILQVPLSGATPAQITDAKYVYSNPVNVAKADGTPLVKDYDYTWIPSNPPQLTGLSTAFPAAGELLTVEYQYLPVVSRNDPAANITNRVDLFTGGTRAQAAQASLIFKQDKKWQTVSSVDLYTGHWLRADQTRPEALNVFIPLPFGPILTVPTTITIGATTYGRATKANPLGTVTSGITYAYQIVHEDTVDGWTPTSRFGLEWHRNYLPANGTAFVVGGNGDYTYNEVPASVQDAVNRWRLAGIDAKVHQAKQRWLRFALGVMYTASSTGAVASVQDAIRTALSDYLNRMGFNSNIQISDVLAVVHQVPGVDNCRLLHGSDVIGYSSANPSASIVGMQQIAPDSAPESGALTSYVEAATGRAKDIYFQDDELPVLGAVVFKTLARNSFGVL